MPTLRFVHPLQNELQQLLMCFTSSHLFLCFIEILSKRSPIFCSLTKINGSPNQISSKNQRWTSLECGFVEHLGRHCGKSHPFIIVQNGDFCWWFEGFQFRLKLDNVRFFFKKRNTFPEIRPFPKRERKIVSQTTIFQGVCLSFREVFCVSSGGF